MKKSVTFEKILVWMKQNHSCLPIFLVGGRNHFNLYYIDENQFYMQKKEGAGIIVTRDWWNRMMKYLDNLPQDDRYKVKKFDLTNDICDECRKYPFAGPNFPAICKAYWSYHKR